MKGQSNLFLAVLVLAFFVSVFSTDATAETSSDGCCYSNSGGYCTDAGPTSCTSPFTWDSTQICHEITLSSKTVKPICANTGCCCGQTGGSLLASPSSCTGTGKEFRSPSNYNSNYRQILQNPSVCTTICGMDPAVPIGEGTSCTALGGFVCSIGGSPGQEISSATGVQDGFKCYDQPCTADINTCKEDPNDAKCLKLQGFYSCTDSAFKGAWKQYGCKETMNDITSLIDVNKQISIPASGYRCCINYEDGNDAPVQEENPTFGKLAVAFTNVGSDIPGTITIYFLEPGTGTIKSKTVTKSSGQFVPQLFDNVRTGSIQVFAEWYDGQQHTRSSNTVTLNKDEPETATINMESVSGNALTVQVQTKADSAAINGAFVFIPGASVSGKTGSDGQILFSLPPGRYTAWVHAINYVSTSVTFDMPTSATTQTIQLDAVPTDDSAITNTISVAHVKGKKEAKVTYRILECSQTQCDSVQLQRCQGTSANCKEDYQFSTLETINSDFPTTPQEYFDKKVFWATDYTYRIVAVKTDSSVTPKTASIKLGDAACEGVMGTAAICTETTTGTAPNILTIAGTKTCDLNNKLTPTSCPDQICQVKNSQAQCVTPEDCYAVSNADPYHLFSSATTCHAKDGCYLDKARISSSLPLASVDSCLSCSASMVCSNYLTEDACKADRCQAKSDSGSCQWKETDAALGFGVCVDSVEPLCETCQKEAQGSISPLRSCDKETCTALGTTDAMCAYTPLAKSACTDCEQTSCNDFVDQVSCGLTTDGVGVSSTQPSQIHMKKWTWIWAYPNTPNDAVRDWYYVELDHDLTYQDGDYFGYIAEGSSLWHWGGSYDWFQINGPKHFYVVNSNACGLSQCRWNTQAQQDDVKCIKDANANGIDDCVGTDFDTGVFGSGVSSAIINQIREACKRDNNAPTTYLRIKPVFRNGPVTAKFDAYDAEAILSNNPVRATYFCIQQVGDTHCSDKDNFIESSEFTITDKTNNIEYTPKGENAVFLMNSDGTTLFSLSDVFDYEVVFYSVDHAQNTEEYKTQKIRRDTKGPEFEVAMYPSNIVQGTGAPTTSTMNFVITAQELASCQMRQLKTPNNEPWKPNTPTSALIHVIEYEEMSDGVYTFEFVCNDSLKNQEKKTIQFALDSDPRLQIEGPRGIQKTQTLTLTGTTESAVDCKFGTQGGTFAQMPYLMSRTLVGTQYIHSAFLGDAKAIANELTELHVVCNFQTPSYEKTSFVVDSTKPTLSLKTSNDEAFPINQPTDLQSLYVSCTDKPEQIGFGCDKVAYCTMPYQSYVSLADKKNCVPSNTEPNIVGNGKSIPLETSKRICFVGIGNQDSTSQIFGHNSSIVCHDFIRDLYPPTIVLHNYTDKVHTNSDLQINFSILDPLFNKSGLTFSDVAGDNNKKQLIISQYEVSAWDVNESVTLNSFNTANKPDIRLFARYNDLTGVYYAGRISWNTENRKYYATIVRDNRINPSVTTLNSVNIEVDITKELNLSFAIQDVEDTTKAVFTVNGKSVTAEFEKDAYYGTVPADDPKAYAQVGLFFSSDDGAPPQIKQNTNFVVMEYLNNNGLETNKPYPVDTSAWVWAESEEKNVYVTNLHQDFYYENGLFYANVQNLEGEYNDPETNELTDITINGKIYLAPEYVDGGKVFTVDVSFYKLEGQTEELLESKIFFQRLYSDKYYTYQRSTDLVDADEYRFKINVGDRVHDDVLLTKDFNVDIDQQPPIITKEPLTIDYKTTSNDFAEIQTKLLNFTLKAYDLKNTIDVSETRMWYGIRPANTDPNVEQSYMKEFILSDIIADQINTDKTKHYLNLTAQIDTLSWGTYDINITVYDDHGNNASVYYENKLKIVNSQFAQTTELKDVYYTNYRDAQQNLKKEFFLNFSTTENYKVAYNYTFGDTKITGFFVAPQQREAKNFYYNQTFNQLPDVDEGEKLTLPIFISYYSADGETLEADQSIKLVIDRRVPKLAVMQSEAGANMTVTDRNTRYFTLHKPSSSTADVTVYLSVFSDELTSCKYGTESATVDKPFELQPGWKEYNTTHIKQVKLNTGQNTFYVNCRDLANNTAPQQILAIDLNRDIQPIIVTSIDETTNKNGLSKLYVETQNRADCTISLNADQLYQASNAVMNAETKLYRHVFSGLSSSLFNDDDYSYTISCTDQKNVYAPTTKTGTLTVQSVSPSLPEIETHQSDLPYIEVNQTFAQKSTVRVFNQGLHFIRSFDAEKDENDALVKQFYNISLPHAVNDLVIVVEDEFGNIAQRKHTIRRSIQPELKSNLFYLQNATLSQLPKLFANWNTDGATAILEIKDETGEVKGTAELLQNDFTDVSSLLTQLADGQYLLELTLKDSEDKVIDVHTVPIVYSKFAESIHFQNTVAPVLQNADDLFTEYEFNSPYENVVTLYNMKIATETFLNLPKITRDDELYEKVTAVATRPMGSNNQPLPIADDEYILTAKARNDLRQTAQTSTTVLFNTNGPQFEVRIAPQAVSQISTNDKIEIDRKRFSVQILSDEPATLNLLEIKNLSEDEEIISLFENLTYATAFTKEFTLPGIGNYSVKAILSDKNNIQSEKQVNIAYVPAQPQALTITLVEGNNSNTLATTVKLSTKTNPADCWYIKGEILDEEGQELPDISLIPFATDDQKILHTAQITYAQRNVPEYYGIKCTSTDDNDIPQTKYAYWKLISKAVPSTITVLNQTGESLDVNLTVQTQKSSNSCYAFDASQIAEDETFADLLEKSISDDADKRLISLTSVSTDKTDWYANIRVPGVNTNYPYFVVCNDTEGVANDKRDDTDSNNEWQAVNLIALVAPLRFSILSPQYNVSNISALNLTIKVNQPATACYYAKDSDFNSYKKTFDKIDETTFNATIVFLSQNTQGQKSEYGIYCETENFGDNKDTPYKVNLSVDTTAPVIQSLYTLPPGDVSADKMVITDPELTAVRLVVKADEPINCTAINNVTESRVPMSRIPFNTSNNLSVAVNTQESTEYNYTVFCQNQAGYVSNRTLLFKTDNTFGLYIEIKNPANGAVYDVSPARLEVETGSPAQSCSYKINQATTATALTSTSSSDVFSHSSFASQVLAEGKYDISVTCDFSGRGIATQTATFTIDKSAPIYKSTLINNKSTTESVEATLFYNESQSDIASYQYAVGTTKDLDDVVTWDTNSNRVIKLKRLDLSSNKTYYFLSRATNRVLLQSPVAWQNFTVKDESDDDEPYCGDGICQSSEKCRCSRDCGSCDGPTPTACTDKVKNGNETDIDCGGACPDCGTGKKCIANADCASGSCDSLLKVCKAATCTDKIKNGDETDIDCGGVCQTKCELQRACVSATDCKSTICEQNVCVDASCTSLKKDGNETDVDCGGGECTACAVGKVCKEDTDCTSANFCQSGKCTDKSKKDTDADGLYDVWEAKYTSAGLDPNSFNDKNADFDKDGLSEIEEMQTGTDPSNPDTDGDTHTDGVEVNELSTDPLDPNDPASSDSKWPLIVLIIIIIILVGGAGGYYAYTQFVKEPARPLPPPMPVSSTTTPTITRRLTPKEKLKLALQQRILAGKKTGPTLPAGMSVKPKISASTNANKTEAGEIEKPADEKEKTEQKPVELVKADTAKAEQPAIEKVRSMSTAAKVEEKAKEEEYVEAVKSAPPITTTQDALKKLQEMSKENKSVIDQLRKMKK